VELAAAMVAIINGVTIILGSGLFMLQLRFLKFNGT
jgi:hypothetical protein